MRASVHVSERARARERERESDRALGEKEQAKITAESFLNWRKKREKGVNFSSRLRKRKERKKS